VIPEGCQIGFDHEHDRARGFHVTESGIVVIGKGQTVTV
jgi:glucose-1-phosphate adenylyltransferase